MKTKDGRIYVIGGASRSGKTWWATKAVKKDARVFAWDPEDQWSAQPGWRRVTKRADLLAAAQKPGRQKVAFVAGGNLAPEFNFWAGVVMYAGRYIAPLTAVAEELADVSSPGKAPANWGILVRRGLKRGISIYAISQRWQEADKTAVGNASEFILFRHNGEEAEKYLKKKTGLPFGEIPLEPLFFIKFDPSTREIVKGKMGR